MPCRRAKCAPGEGNTQGNTPRRRRRTKTARAKKKNKEEKTTRRKENPKDATFCADEKDANKTALDEPTYPGRLLLLPVQRAHLCPSQTKYSERKRGITKCV
jgi:hypothetical protein